MIIDKKRQRYFIAGIMNTIFGYLIAIYLYKNLANNFNILIIGFFINVISISFSFFVYKIFVFKTKGFWLQEYVKSFITYGVSAVIGLALLWMMVDILGLSIWYAQAYAMTLTGVISYLGHAYFTFKNAINKERQ
jgi:putative flippase GtrA